MADGGYRLTVEGEGTVYQGDEPVDICPACTESRHLECYGSFGIGERTIADCDCAAGPGCEAAVKAAMRAEAAGSAERVGDPLDGWVELGLVDDVPHGLEHRRLDDPAPRVTAEQLRAQLAALEDGDRRRGELLAELTGEAYWAPAGTPPPGPGPHADNRPYDISAGQGSPAADAGTAGQGRDGAWLTERLYEHRHAPPVPKPLQIGGARYVENRADRRRKRRG